MLGNETDKFLNKSLLSKFSIGVLINNDYLVFNSFQISFSFYPKIPFQGTNIFNTSSYKNNDLSLNVGSFVEKGTFWVIVTGRTLLEARYSRLY